MNAPVVIHRQISDASPIDDLAARAIGLMLCAAQVKNVALRALIRLASDELAAIEGWESVAKLHAVHVRIAEERRLNALRPQRVRR